jgi:hypothetical protein
MRRLDASREPYTPRDTRSRPAQPAPSAIGRTGPTTKELTVKEATTLFVPIGTASCLGILAGSREVAVASRPSPPSKPTYDSVDVAALRLSTTPIALRARCRRRARREGRDIVAHLGGGILAIKLGVSWRVRFPD